MNRSRGFTANLLPASLGNDRREGGATRLVRFCSVLHTSLCGSCGGVRTRSQAPSFSYTGTTGAGWFQGPKRITKGNGLRQRLPKPETKGGKGGGNGRTLRRSKAPASSSSSRSFLSSPIRLPPLAGLLSLPTSVYDTTKDN
ncbi:hypothetical protein KC367_g32 [Hortaea werneckii]|nr:hypothetical protein KC367_g32 [Hortaea werneckii]